MTRQLKSAKAAEGNGWGSMPDDQPRTCFFCSKPILISREDCGFSTLTKQSFHMRCADEART